MVKFLTNFFSLASYLEDRKIGRCKAPVYVVLLSLFAATGGLMFGYDIGVSGGVTVMDNFLCKFFDGVLEKKIESEGLKDISIKGCKYIKIEDWDKDEDEYTKKGGGRDQLYCLFGNQNVQLFTSSLYLAAMVGTCFAAYVSKQGGRKMTIILAGLFYDVGVAFNIASGSISNSHHVAFWMLILGRMMLGLGVGFGNQAIPLFISEIAPANARGALNHFFQLNVTVGILLASIVNWKAEKIHPWGWRLSLGLAGIPALIFTIGILFLIETPNSLVQRGLIDQAQQVLSKIRGKGLDITLALQGMVTATSNGNLSYTNIDQTTLPPHHNAITSNSNSRKIPQKQFNGLFSRSNRPPLVIAICVQLFQQFTGINVVILYAPVLFKAFGSKTQASLQSALVIAIVNVGFTVVSIFLVDRYGRRRLLLVASLIMLLTQLSIGIILIGTDRKDELDTWHAILVLVFVSTFVGAFACSWGPVGWLISTEIFPLACRSEGQSVTVFFNMLFTFIIAHASLSMLCTMKFTIFFFFASLAAIMGALTYFFLPETMNMEIEIMGDIWYYHWYWRVFVTQSQSLDPHIFPPSPSISLTSQLPFPSAPHMEMSKDKIMPIASHEDSIY